MIKHIIALSASAILLSGCSVFSVGEDPSCPGLPSGVSCKSAKEVYMMTNHRSHLENMTAEEAESLERKALGIESTNQKSKTNDEGFMSFFTREPRKSYKNSNHNESSTPRNQPMTAIDTGMNIDTFDQMELLRQQDMLRDEQSIMRTPSKVLRLKFAKWEDDNGRLHDPGKIYIEIEARKWVVGSEKVQSMPIITPLQIRNMSLEEIREKQTPSSLDK